MCVCVCVTRNLAYRGSRIVSAAVRQVKSKYGLSGVVLFGGTSAGGRGAFMNIDIVTTLLRDTAKVVGLLDSPLWMDIQPLDVALPSLMTQTRKVVAHVNASAVLNAACARVHTLENVWRCAFGEFRLPYVETPYLLLASQDHSFQMNQNGVRWPPFPPEGRAWAQEFHVRMQV